MNSFLRARCSGFSLVEVVLALGIAAFCLLSLLSLLPVGIHNDTTSFQQTFAANLASAVVTDLRSAPLNTASYSPTRTLYSPRFHFTVPVAGVSPQTVFVGKDYAPLTLPGANLPAGTGGAIYRISVIGPARPSGSQPQRTASPLYILITWPGQADPAATQLPGHYSGSFETVTYLDQN